MYCTQSVFQCIVKRYLHEKKMIKPTNIGKWRRKHNVLLHCKIPKIREWLQFRMT